MPMDKIKLEICLGTTCYMLGGSKLLDFVKQLPEHWKNRIEVSGVPCMNACTEDEIGNAPFVSVNGTRYGKATPDSVYKILKKIFGETDE